MKIQVCMGKSCKSRFAEYITKRLKLDLDFHKLDGVIIEESLCMGHCDKGPNVFFDKHLEHYMNPIKASKLLLDKKKGNNNGNGNNKKNNNSNNN
ncbi:MAG: NAD(P)H-dependent oxidoreductase subunit E [Candidatus Gracilibacteria bacterium]|nr:NAD(P)H-dependent oxidoreductase subunit E [Candidatus Gracilibacteria bacterium]